MSSLGLLMQLSGTLGMIAASLIALAGTFVSPLAMPGLLFATGVVCWIRAAHHRAAGTALLYRSDAFVASPVASPAAGLTTGLVAGLTTGPAAAVLRYILVSVGQTGFCLFLLHDHVSLAVLAQLGAVSLAWPVVLATYFALPGVRRVVSHAIPRSEDLGFEGVSVLMVALGIVGVLFAATFVALFLGDLTTTLKSTAMSGTALIFVVLLVRSLIHVRAGLDGISGASFDQHLVLGRGYHDTGTGSAACVGAAFFVLSMLSVHPAQLWVALASGTTAGLALFTWPSLLRRFYMERNFEVYLAASRNGHSEPSFERAPDAGLTALGWLLLAVSSPAVALSLAGLSGIGASAWSRFDQAGWGAGWGAGWADVGANAYGWLIILAGLGLWAGVELLRMSQRRKKAAAIFAVVAVAMMIAPLGLDLGGPRAVLDLAGQGGEASLTALRTTLVYFLTALAMATAIIANRRSLPATIARIVAPGRIADSR